MQTLKVMWSNATPQTFLAKQVVGMSAKSRDDNHQAVARFIFLLKTIDMNKNKLFLGIAVVAIAALATWNASMSTRSSELSDMQLANVEALAAAEMSWWEHLGNWISGEGWEKDDYIRSIPCTVVKETTKTPWYTSNSNYNVNIPLGNGYGVSVGGSTSLNLGSTTKTTVSYEGKVIYCDRGGDVNCDPHDCH